MKNTVRLYSMLIALTASIPSGAAIAASGWTDSTPILELNQQPTVGVGSMLVFIETNVAVNPSGCSYAKGFYFAVNDDRQKRLFAMLLSAQMSGRNVRIYTTGTCHTPWGYAELDGLVVN